MANPHFSTKHGPPIRIPHGDAASVDAGGAQLRVHDRDGVIVISVDGEVDSFNVDRVDDYARAFVRAAQPMVLDFSETKFFCARGGGYLIEFDELCQKAGLLWALVMSQSVDRVIRVIGPEATLPVAISLAEALGMIRRQPAPSW
jgi:anti-anti-sigma regulatory factor